MDYFYDVIQLLAGLGAFLIGFKLLSDNIEKLANSRLKKLFQKTSKNRLIGVGIGTLVTAVIQSSSATTVMIVGFVNAGLMDLFTATSMIMGANIGTTITAQIVALQAFDIVKFLMIFACVGIFIFMFGKKEKTKSIGLSLGGLGLVFLALKIMSSSMDGFKNSQVIVDILSSANNPFLLLLIGIFFTALIQSSSATTTILISMVSAGLTIGNGGNAILFVILGSNIGTCITALLSSIGASSNAKRASLIHLMFNLFGALIFFVALLLWPSFMDMTFGSWFEYEATQIAMFHTFFNLLMTIIFLPFIKIFVNIANFLIKDKKITKNDTFLDERFLKTPAIAISQTSKEVIKFGELSMNTLIDSINIFVEKKVDDEDKIKENLKTIDKMNQNILEYLVRISSNDLDNNDEKYISILHKVINDFYREGEIADNMIKYTNTTIDNKLEFSDDVYSQINAMKDKLVKQYKMINEMFVDNNYSLINEIDELEDSIDEMRSMMINNHILRLEKGKCKPANSGVYINLVSNLERAGDHLSYIAHSLINEDLI